MDIQDFEQRLGFPETKNFRTHQHHIEAHHRCYYTGKLELPDSYEGLRMKDGSEQGCDLDEEKYDVFFYPIEAVASGDAPVTSSLAAASLERLLVVVPHEDFHDHSQAQALPEPINEAASTLIGFLTAADFAHEHYGPDSPTYQNLSREAQLFLHKAEVVNDFHARLSGVYEAVREKRLTVSEGVREKHRLLAELREDCLAIEPEPGSFNRCPGAVNNAGLAFDHTYTKFYPLMHELFVAVGRDLQATVEAIQQPPGREALSEPAAVRYFQDIIEKRRANQAVAN